MFNGEIPEHYRRAQKGEQPAVSNFWVLQSTLSQTGEQGKASYTPALRSVYQFSIL